MWRRVVNSSHLRAGRGCPGGTPQSPTGLLSAPQDPQRAALAVFDELARVECGPPDLVGRTSAVGRIGEDVVDGQPPAFDHLRRPTPVVGPRRFRAVTPVDEAEGQRRRPVGRDGGRIAHDADDRRLQSGPAHRVPPAGKGIDPAGLRVDQGAVMMLPSDLVLLGSVVVVQTEQDRARLFRRRPEVDARFAAPRPDLHEGGPFEGGTGSQRGQVQGLALVIGHEAGSRPGGAEELVAPLPSLGRGSLRGQGARG